MVAAVEQMASEPSPSREGHLERLEEIYCSLLGPAAAARGRCGGKRPAGERAGGAREQRWFASSLRARLRRGGTHGRSQEEGPEGSPGIRKVVG